MGVSTCTETRSSDSNQSSADAKPPSRALAAQRPANETTRTRRTRTHSQTGGLRTLPPPPCLTCLGCAVGGIFLGRDFLGEGPFEEAASGVRGGGGSERPDTSRSFSSSCHERRLGRSGPSPCFGCSGSCDQPAPRHSGHLISFPPVCCAHPLRASPEPRQSSHRRHFHPGLGSAVGLGLRGKGSPLAARAGWSTTSYPGCAGRRGAKAYAPSKRKWPVSDN